ncbi:MAG: SHOCT domain-containing protein [Saccharofermentanales bacterium]
MNKDEAILRYKSAMAVFKNWHSEGVISGDDLQAIDTMLAQKYGLSSCSIFLENDLLCKENRVIYGSTKGGHYGQKDNKN